MKSVLISIRPKWVEKIAGGQKTIEVRRSAPKEVPFKCYIYETKGQYVKFTHGALTKYGYGRGKVIGEFICDNVERFEEHIEKGGLYYILSDTFNEQAQLDNWELHDYGKGKTLYGWHISDLKIYDKPRELSDFLKPCPDTFHYCTICKHCVKIIPPDEEEYALYHGGQYDYWEEHCTNRLTSPPQSWRYVEDLREE